jgi:hypothetical protein
MQTGCFLLAIVLTGTAAGTPPRQVTRSCRNHELDNNDNFSACGRYLCYDTRETAGPGIDNGQSIEMLEIAAGREIVLYRPAVTVIGEKAAPGVGAVSFSPAAPEAAFIHGPPVDEVKDRGYYGKPNRCGARVRIDGRIVKAGGEYRMLDDGAYTMSWIDRRDIAADRDTLPGAHRGGTHRHEYSRNGKRIGFTYDDFLLPQYDRTVGYMEAHPEAPEDATHYFAVLVPVVPRDKAAPGDIVKAAGDSWVDAAGTMRAFIGTIIEEDGSEQDSLFVIDMPAGIDITTADSGGPDRFPAPPEGVVIRRLTRSWAGGIVRGGPGGKRIAFYGRDKDGIVQLFIMPADGSESPVQVSFFDKDAVEGLRWHPSGDTLFCVTDDGIAAVDIRRGETFGKHRFLTPHGDGVRRYAPAISPDGKQIAFNQAVVTRDGEDQVCTNYKGENFSQIFLIDYSE